MTIFGICLLYTSVEWLRLLLLGGREVVAT